MADNQNQWGSTSRSVAITSFMATSLVYPEDIEQDIFESYAGPVFDEDDGYEMEEIDRVRRLPNNPKPKPLPTIRNSERTRKIDLTME